MSDITLLRKVECTRGIRGRLYYYQGNFYFPMSLKRPGEVKRAIREFTRKNRARIEADRANPSYKTKVELFDEGLRTV